MGFFRFKRQPNTPELDIPDAPTPNLAKLREQIAADWDSRDFGNYPGLYANEAAPNFEAALKDPAEAFRMLGSSAVFEARDDMLDAGELFVQQALSHEAEARWHIRIPLLQKAGISIGDISELPPYHTEQAVSLWRSDEIARSKGIARSIGQALHIGTTANVYFENETIKKLQQFDAGRPLGLAVESGALVIAELTSPARAA